MQILSDNKWGGETVIYEDDGETFHAAVPYSPGSFIMEPALSTHAIRSPSVEMANVQIYNRNVL